MGKIRASSNKSTPKGTQRRTIQQQATDDTQSTTQPHTADTQWQTRDAIRHILILFLASRALLTVIGLLARKYMGPLFNIGDLQNFVVMNSGEIIIWTERDRLRKHLEGIAQIGLGTGYPWLDIWGAWDSRWYVTIAETWYSTPADRFGHAPPAFLPLYPILMKVFGWPFGNSYYGGVIVSNLALLAGAWLLYKLVYEMKGHEVAKRAVLFMFLFPTSFLFSAVLTEALFVALSIGSFYCARRKHWLVAGMLGGLSAVTRLPGMFIGLLLFLEYMRQRQFRIPKIRADVLWLALVPLGSFMVMLTGYMTKGSFFALFEAQAAWAVGQSFLNPIMVLWHALDGTTPPPQVDQLDLKQGKMLWPVLPLTLSFGIFTWTFTPLLVFCTMLTIYVLAVLAWGHKRVGFDLLVWCAFLILVPLSGSIAVMVAMPRYMVVVFPIFLALAHLRPGRLAYYTTAVVLILVQAGAMALWTNNYNLL